MKWNQLKSIRYEAFTLVESLMAFLICGILTLLLSMMAQSLIAGYRMEPGDQDQFAIVQLRELTAGARFCSVKNGVLILETSKHRRQLAHDRNRLVFTPGYEIIMESVDSAAFSMESGRIWLEYEKNGRTRKYQIL